MPNYKRHRAPGKRKGWTHKKRPKLSAANFSRDGKNNKQLQRVDFDQISPAESSPTMKDSISENAFETRQQDKPDFPNAASSIDLQSQLLALDTDGRYDEEKTETLQTIIEEDKKRKKKVLDENDGWLDILDNSSSDQYLDLVTTLSGDKYVTTKKEFKLGEALCELRGDLIVETLAVKRQLLYVKANMIPRMHFLPPKRFKKLCIDSTPEKFADFPGRHITRCSSAENQANLLVKHLLWQEQPKAILVASTDIAIGSQLYQNINPK